MVGLFFSPKTNLGKSSIDSFRASGYNKNNNGDDNNENNDDNEKVIIMKMVVVLLLLFIIIIIIIIIIKGTNIKTLKLQVGTKLGCRKPYR